MSLELLREPILLNNKAGRQSTQIMVEGDIIVPDIKPDISSVLRVECSPKMTEERVLDDRVSFAGELSIAVIYQAKKSEKLLHSMAASLPIEDFINMDGVAPEDQVTIAATILHMEQKLINDRKLNVKAVLAVSCEAEKEQEIEMVKNVSDMPAMQVLRGRMNINRQAENKKDRFVVKEQVVLPQGKPNIREPLLSSCSLSDKEVRAMDGKVLLKGILHLSFLYVGDTEESLAETMEEEIPFNGYIEAKNVTEAMEAQAKLSVDDVTANILTDDDGEDRVIDLEATIGADLRVNNDEAVDYIQDAYCIGQPLEIKKETISYPQNVAQNHTKTSIKETVTIDGKYPEALQVKKVFGNVSLDDVELVDDRLIAEGVIHLEILYIAENDNQPVNVAPVDIPFRQEIEVKGARKDMEVDITADIEDIAFNMLSGREVEIRVTLGFDVFVMREENGTIITDILTVEDGKEDLEDIASAAIYVVQKGDTLWNIAKRYNTTVEDITMLNEIENPDKIYPGEKLLILKRVEEF